MPGIALGGEATAVGARVVTDFQRGGQSRFLGFAAGLAFSLTLARFGAIFSAFARASLVQAGRLVWLEIIAGCAGRLDGGT